MKNIKSTYSFSVQAIVALLAVVMLGSCAKVNEQDPFSSIDPKDVYNNPKRIENAAIGMYNALQNAEFLGGRALIYIDQRGNDASVASYFGQIPTFNMLSNNGTALLAWTGAYRSIYEANNFLYNLQKNESVIGADAAKPYYAEAKFCRALVYYYLVNIYAQTYAFTADGSHLGVPLITAPPPQSGAEAFDPVHRVARSTVKQVYDAIIKDLKEAETDLPDDWGEGFFDRVRATKGAANGLLSRVYLTMGDYPNASTYADKVINSPYGYELEDDPYTNFNKESYTASTEIIFNIAMNSGDNPNTNNAIGQHYSPYGRGDVTVFAGYLNLPNFGATDKRKNDTMIIQIGTAFYTGKFAETPFDSWVPVMRYAEILLNKAEALARINPAVDGVAADMLNALRARSNAHPVLPATKDELIAAILNERRLELAFEGFGMIDFLRTKRNIPARGAAQPEQDWNDEFTPWPIPFQETQQNKNLAQNPGYN